MKKSNKEEFIKKSIEVHGDRFDYSLVEFVGCPFCINESKGEKTIEKILYELGISYERQKTFNDCKDKKKLPFDFYLPEKNMCIEYNGMIK